MAPVRMIAVIGMRGINPFIPVSASQANALKHGWRGPLPVRVRVNDKPAIAWRINLMPAGDGSYFLYLHGDLRKASGARVGDRVRAEITFDNAYQGGPRHPVPGWFKEALAGNPEARRNWKVLPPSRKKEVLRYISDLKSPEARRRNLTRAVQVLSGGTGRFLGRLWRNGS